MRLLDSPTYRQDVERVAQLPIDWDRLRGTTLALSGASGMIGSFLVDVLMARNAEGLDCTIQALVRDRTGFDERFADYANHPNLGLVVGDVGLGPLPDLRADYVIHAASNTHPVAYATDPIGTITTNVNGTRNMLDLAVRAGTRRAAFLSTVEIYGECRQPDQWFQETDLGYIDCNTLRAGYPESKRAGEALCQAFRAQHGLEVTIPRLPRIYGPTLRSSDTKALSQFLFRAVAGQDIVLKSDGTQFYSYCQVADAVSAVLVCLLSGEDGAAYNVAHPSGDVRLRDLAELVARAAGTKVVYDLPSDLEQRGYSAATRAVMDGTKLARLGWEPMFSVDEGVRRTLAVFKESLINHVPPSERRIGRSSPPTSCDGRPVHVQDVGDESHPAQRPVDDTASISESLRK